MKILFLSLAVFMGLAFRSVSEQTPEEIRQKGDKITAVTGQTLSKSVMNAIAKGGVSEAVKFCNVAAYPLTDSLAKANQVLIKRTAIRWRNSKNKPSKQEKKIFAAFELENQQGKTLEAKIIKQKNGVWLYAKPIIMQAQCQVCHGKLNETLLVDNYKTIKKYYPKDKAIGFSTGDIRGMWVLAFKN
jgi:hypothetical protein